MLLFAGRVGGLIRDVLCSVSAVHSMSVNGDIQKGCQIIGLGRVLACTARCLSCERDNKLSENGYGDARSRHKSLIRNTFWLSAYRLHWLAPGRPVAEPCFFLR